MDLEITNRVKEELLRRVQTQLNQADDERKAYIERLIADSRKIGELETRTFCNSAVVMLVLHSTFRTVRKTSAMCRTK